MTWLAAASHAGRFPRSTWQLVVGEECVLTHLNLCLSASSDVRDGPASLLLYALLVAGLEQVEQARQRIAVDDDLGLRIVAGDYIAHCA